MVGELRHEETLAELRRADEKICAGVKQAFDNWRLALKDSLVEFLHGDRCEEGRIEHLQDIQLHL